MYANLFLYILDAVTGNLAFSRSLIDTENFQSLLLWWNKGTYF
jgi:hypothetical protein